MENEREARTAKGRVRKSAAASSEASYGLKDILVVLEYRLRKTLRCVILRAKHSKAA